MSSIDDLALEFKVKSLGLESYRRRGDNKYIVTWSSGLRPLIFEAGFRVSHQIIIGLDMRDRLEAINTTNIIELLTLKHRIKVRT